MSDREASRSAAGDGGYLAALRETSVALGQRMEPSGLLEQIVARAAQVVGTGDGYICLVEPGGGDMVLRVGVGTFADLVGLRMVRGEGLSGQVWQRAAPVAVPDYDTWLGRVKAVRPGRFHAALGVPLEYGGTVTGVIGLAFSEPGRRFSEAEVEQVSRFAELASVALENARMYAGAQQEIDERKRTEEQLRPEQAGALNFWKSVLHPDDRERVLAEEARCEQTGEAFRMEYRVFDRHGKVRWVRDECVLVRSDSGEPLFWQGVVFDITDAKRTEQATVQALARERE